MFWSLRPHFAACAILATGCASLSAQGQKVQIVSDASSVRTCRSLGKVQATPPYGVPDDWKVQLRNESGKLGGNKILAQDPGLSVGSVEGEAFTCDESSGPK